MNSTNRILRVQNPAPFSETSRSWTLAHPGLFDLSAALNAMFVGLPDDRASSITASPAFARANRYSLTWKSEDAWKSKAIQNYLYTMCLATQVADQILLTEQLETSRSADQRKLTDCFARLAELAENIQEEPISEQSRRVAAIVLTDVFALMRNEFPVPLIGADEEGGIGFTWRHGDKTIRAVFPPSARKRPFLYYREGDKYGLLDSFSASTLSAWLGWLTEDERKRECLRSTWLHFHSVPSTTQKEMPRRAK